MTAAVAPSFTPRSPLNAAYQNAHAPMFTETVNPQELPDVQPLSQYERDPVGFLVDVLGIPEHRLRWSMNAGYDKHEWDGTPDPLVAMLEGLANWDDVGVEAGTGTQKSHTAAAAILWFTGSFKEARTFTFAPKEEQLRAFVWMEIGKLWPRFKLQFPLAVLTDLRIRMRGPRDAAWGAQGFAVGKRAGEEISVNAQGMHAQHMLLVYEETPGIAPAVVEAGENTATAPHNIRLALGNPDHQLDALHLFGHDQFGQVRPGVLPIRISALDHPNIVTGDSSIVPGAVSKKSVDKRLIKYKETGRLYKSRVRGLSPAEAAEALIKLEWVQAAQKRWLDEKEKDLLTKFGKAKKALGVDVANSEDGDEGAVSRWTGAYCREVEAKPCPDANRLGYEVVQEMKRDRIDDENVGIDAVGVGAGAVNEAKRLERFVRALGSKASNQQDGEIITLTGDDVVAEEKFNVPRSRWYWRLREDLRLGSIALPPDPELSLDLITPTWKTLGGVIIVESKETLSDRLPGGRSPNKGDCVAYGNWVRDRETPVSRLPKRNPTIQERLQKELENMDKQERQSSPSARQKYGGGPLRQ